MGACFECLVRVEGEGAVQACLTPVREGMVVETGAGRRDIAAEGEG
jgi:D-hydroxyproline dehydrogenase subunit gamma